MILPFLLLFLLVTTQLVCRHTILVPARINLEMAKTLFDSDDFKLNYNHLYELSLIKSDNKRMSKFLVYGFHHDYLRIFEKKGFVAYKDVIQGPASSFAARTIINGKDHGLKSFFSPNWSHEKVIETIKGLCCERYASVSKEHVKDRDVFTATTAEGLTVKIVFDIKNSQVITAYPVIQMC